MKNQMDSQESCIIFQTLIQATNRQNLQNINLSSRRQHQTFNQITHILRNNNCSICELKLVIIYFQMHRFTTQIQYYANNTHPRTHTQWHVLKVCMCDVVVMYFILHQSIRRQNNSLRYTTFTHMTEHLYRFTDFNIKFEIWIIIYIHDHER